MQEHPELTYAPSKKKGPKRGAEDKDNKDLKDVPEHPSTHSTPYAVTPDLSPRCTTPRQVVTNTGFIFTIFFVSILNDFATLLLFLIF